MSLRPDLFGRPKEDNGVIKAALDFDSSDEEFDYDKKLDEMVISQDGTPATADRFANKAHIEIAGTPDLKFSTDRSKNPSQIFNKFVPSDSDRGFGLDQRRNVTSDDFAANGTSSSKVQSLSRQDVNMNSEKSEEPLAFGATNQVRPRLEPMSSNTNGHKDNESQKKLDTTSGLSYRPSVNNHNNNNNNDNSNNNGNYRAVSPSTISNYNNKFENVLINQRSDHSSSSAHLPERLEDHLNIDESKKNKAMDPLVNTPKKRKHFMSDDAFVDLTGSDEDLDEIPDDSNIMRTISDYLANDESKRQQYHVSNILRGDEDTDHNNNIIHNRHNNNIYTTVSNKIHNIQRTNQPADSNISNEIPSSTQKEIIDLSDLESTEEEADDIENPINNNDPPQDEGSDEEIQIISVKEAPAESRRHFNNNNENNGGILRSTYNHFQNFLADTSNLFLPSSSSSSSAHVNIQPASGRLYSLAQSVEALKNEYNKTAQILINKKTEQRKIADNIANLKRTDAVLAQSTDPVSKSLVASGRLRIAELQRSYNGLVKENIALEKKSEEKRRDFLNGKVMLTKYNAELSSNGVVDIPEDPMDYNRSYQNAIMSQSSDYQTRGYASNVYTDDNKSLQKLLNNIKPDETYVEGRAKTPEGLGVSLLPHQRIGLAWLQAMEESSNKGGILADDMGLGKTVQALALMLSNRSEDPQCKTDLIVAPIALLKQWEQEILSKIKPAYALRVFIYHQQDKLKTFQALRQYDVVLISYNTLASEMKKHYALAISQAKVAKNSSIIPDRDSGGQSYRSPFYTSDAKFHRIILDEAQWVKNKLTQASKSVALLEAELRWCLSGTPMQNSVDELYSLIRFLRIKPYNVEAKFRGDIFLPIKNASSDRYDSIDTSTAMRKLRALLKAILLRRTKDSEIDGKPILQLPAKQILKENVEMFDQEREYYRSLEKHSAREANTLLQSKSRGNYSSILTLLLRLRQACCHKYLVELGDRKNEKYDASKVPPSVVRALAPNVVQRILREVESGFTCPICFDSVANERIAILSPCGHVLCQDCVEQFFEQFQTNNSSDSADDGNRVASCMTCRGNVHESDVFKYELFDMVINKDWSDEQIRKQFTHDFTSNSKLDRRRNLIRLVEEEGGGKLKSSAKIDICIKTIEEILAQGSEEKIIVFSQFTLLFEIMKIVMDSKRMEYLQYDGSMSSDDRNATIGRFYRDPSKRILLLSLKAGNVGLTLTCANHVIIMDPFWNPFVEEQAMDRAHRIGQQREVHVHKLLIKDTVEDRILQLQEKKKEMINSALDSEGLSTISRLGHNEIRFLFGLDHLNQ